MQNILVTGSNGQLGNEIRVIAPNYQSCNFIFTDVDELDICNRKAVVSFFEHQKIDFLINCAAYTAVAKAEEDAETAYLINCTAVQNLAEIANKFGCKMIHVSTDYVFDGKNYLPYTEEMPIQPQSVYGKTKAEGEAVLQKATDNAIILRTSWLYSSFGNNFVKTMLRLGAERESVSVIFDQIGTPTYAADLALAILEIIVSGKFEAGIYHYSDEGVCSWYDFAIAIFKLSKITCQVNPIEAKDFYDKTPRPFYSVLNKAKIKTVYGLSIPHWEESLEQCLVVIKKGA